ncbi:MAG: hypothetical protein CMG62_06170 [Candidatus Marinimicrobia bacterium]|nr:hypothetical protein [Candidatus Neomarinimicrobiota bacterium]|tara:strand:- start:2350 stop:2667 length:318 start_codon:yes stop_codon:yes gene_type:complete
MKSVSVKQLKKLLDSGEKSFELLDVREKNELMICQISKAVHIPMMSIPKRMGEININKNIIVMCHSGVRSMQVCSFLNGNGYNAINLEGGIDAYAVEIDSNMKRY